MQTLFPGAFVVPLMTEILRALRMHGARSTITLLGRSRSTLRGARAHGCGEQATEWTLSRQT
jgi:hypothetical protein